MKLTFFIIINLFVSTQLLAENDILVDTTSGNVFATKSKNVLIFEDIPYAQPPVGNLRWKAPKAISSPVKIFPKENNFCVQRPSNLGGVAGDKFYVGTEDCLYLDVFVPSNVLDSRWRKYFWS